MQSDPIGTVLYRDMATKNLAQHGMPRPELASLLYRAQPEFNHPYAYVDDNPTSLVDPEGLMGFGGGGSAGRNRSAPKQPTGIGKCIQACIEELNPAWTVPAGGVAGGMALGSGGTAAAGAVCGTVLAGWGLGTSTGCALQCSADPQSYGHQ